MTAVVELRWARRRRERYGTGYIEKAMATRNRVLVVDDERFVCTLLERVLRADSEVTTALAARQALAMITRGEQFDVILCDLLMPDMTGMEFYEQLRTIAPDQATRVIFLTGGAFTEAAHAFRDSVPNPFIDKPFDLSSLLQLVRQRMRGSAAP